MLGLKLREEFLRQALEDTAVELTDKAATGAAQLAAPDFLETTFPSSQAMAALEAVAPGKAGPVVLCGPRGQGKSHILGLIHHSLTDSSAVGRWLEDWQKTCAMREGMEVITENLHRKNYKAIWDLIFNWHVQGEWARGQWEQLGDHGTQVPPYEVMVELFKKRPTALILDEYDAWFDALGESNEPTLQTAALEFLYVLAKVAQDHPDLLVLVVAVGDAGAAAIQDLDPVTVDFTPKADFTDRRGLLLFKMFENRAAIAEEDIRDSLSTHVAEFIRLKKVSGGEHDDLWQSFIEAWPFSPALLDVASNRFDHPGLFVRFLAILFEQNDASGSLITPAAIAIRDDGARLAGLFDSNSDDGNQSLLAVARDNLDALVASAPSDAAPPCGWEAVVSSLWLRSLSASGADPTDLQTDVTGDEAFDDEAFAGSLTALSENCVNVHDRDGVLVLEHAPNRETRLRKEAACDQHFSGGTDRAELIGEIKQVIGNIDRVEKMFNLVVLPKPWLTDPWSRLDESERPTCWDDRITLVVVPEASGKLESQLGEWLEAHVAERRNTVRFLLPSAKKGNIFEEPELQFLVRAKMLAAQWQAEDPDYKKLEQRCQRELRAAIRKIFTRFAILDVWNSDDASKSKFHIVRQRARGAKLPEAVDEYVRDTLFDPDAFETLLLALAKNSTTVTQLLEAVREPRPNQEHCIPWIGEEALKEKIAEACARGKVDIDAAGGELIKARDDAAEEAVWNKIREQLEDDEQLGNIKILLPKPAGVAEAAIELDSAEAGFDSGDDEEFGDLGKTVDFEPAPELAASIEGAGPGLVVPDETGVQAAALDQAPLGAPTEAHTTRPGDAGAVLEADAVAESGADTATDTTACPGPVGGGSNFKLYHSPPVSLATLLRNIDGWEIKDSSVVERFMVKVEKLTGAQLRRLLRHLPEELDISITLQKLED